MFMRKQNPVLCILESHVDHIPLLYYDSLLPEHKDSIRTSYHSRESTLYLILCIVKTFLEITSNYLATQS